MTDKELIQGALSRVNFYAHTRATLQEVTEGFYCVRGLFVLPTDTLPVDEMLAYLHGVEDAFRLTIDNP